MAKETPEIAEAFTVTITTEQAHDENSVVRLISRDASKGDADIEEMPIIGSISFNMKQYFGEMPKSNYGQTLS